MPRYKLIVVDDEESMRNFLSIMLKKEGYEVSTFSTGEAALEFFRDESADIVMTDLKMPGMGGVALLKGLKALDPNVAVILMTAYASVDSAVEAMRAGAYDYFTKPFNIDEIKLHLKRALRLKELEEENILLKKDIHSRYGFSNIIGTSPLMVEVYTLITSAAGTRTNVLVSGESGTGKELVARALHTESERKDKPFVTINCGAIPENLLESELFGHKKGAFTGAVKDKAGLAEMADGGTLFLDEITELPLNLQVKLLRFLQEKTVRRVGGSTDKKVDIRVIAATNRDIESEVEAGRFREDLFYRLNVLGIDLPPLRKRKEDIAKLAEFFFEKYVRETGKAITRISEQALALLIDYDYSGNVRELENAIERGVALEATDVLTAASLPPSIRDFRAARAAVATRGPGAVEPGSDGVVITEEGLDLEKVVSEFERKIIEDALEKTGGVKKKAAELLKISFRSMRYKLSKYEDTQD
ncbi:Nitrogen regulation protein NR(I) [hydrothermal vent metagenome]|uniref:Nitrogen regulation protein NR(I) n=1 Tax=hydrothermal vent metagenome TaxID=652676 RepID=A0A3B0V3T4_9ZZZZ